MKWSIISFKLASLSCACCRSCARSSAGRRSVVCSRAVIGRPPLYSRSPRPCSARARSFLNSWCSFGLLLSFVFFEPVPGEVTREMATGYRAASLLDRVACCSKIASNMSSMVQPYKSARRLIFFVDGNAASVSHLETAERSILSAAATISCDNAACLRSRARPFISYDLSFLNLIHIITHSVQNFN